jgi:hypothetical protein
MSIKEIAALIEETKNYYWPGGETDEEVEGLDGIGKSKSQ